MKVLQCQILISNLNLNKAIDTELGALTGAYALAQILTKSLLDASATALLPTHDATSCGGVLVAGQGRQSRLAVAGQKGLGLGNCMLSYASLLKVITIR